MMEVLGVIELAAVLLFLRGGYLVVREAFRRDYRPEKWNEDAESRGLMECGIGIFVALFLQGALEVLK